MGGRCHLVVGVSVTGVTRQLRRVTIEKIPTDGHARQNCRVAEGEMTSGMRGWTRRVELFCGRRCGRYFYQRGPDAMLIAFPQAGRPTFGSGSIGVGEFKNINFICGDGDTGRSPRPLRFQDGSHLTMRSDLHDLMATGGSSIYVACGVHADTAKKGNAGIDRPMIGGIVVAIGYRKWVQGAYDRARGV